jgi:hypothetical protein
MRKFSAITGNLACSCPTPLADAVSNSFCKILNYRLMMSNKLERMMKEMVVAKHSHRMQWK